MVAIPILETVTSVITTVMIEGSYAGLVALMFFESFGIPPLPSEIILPLAGSLVVLDGWSLPAVLAAALLGGVLGAYAAYAVGRWGRQWVTNPKLGILRLKPEHLATVDGWFARRGEATVGISRLLPVIRSYISYPAGTARMEPTRFGIYTVAGSFPFTLALVYAGVVLGQHWSDVVATFRYLDFAALGVLAVLVTYIVLRWRREEVRGGHSE